jgi:hypothetical protein
VKKVIIKQNLWSLAFFKKKKTTMTLGEENVMTVTCITYSPGLSSATTESGEMQGK